MRRLTEAERSALRTASVPYDSEPPAGPAGLSHALTSPGGRLGHFVAGWAASMLSASLNETGPAPLGARWAC